MDDKDLKNRFAYHPPKDDETRNKHESVRGICLTVAGAFNEMLPDGREKALAITHLEDSMMWANAAIARHES